MRVFPHQEEQQMTLNELFKNTTYDDTLFSVEAKSAIRKDNFMSEEKKAIDMTPEELKQWLSYSFGRTCKKGNGVTEVTPFPFSQVLPKG